MSYLNDQTLKSYIFKAIKDIEMIPKDPSLENLTI